MGTSAKDVKNRIKSVESTMHITKAMELLAKEKDLSNVTGLIRAINDFVRSSTEPGESGEGERSAHSLMIEKAIMHINQAAHL